MKNFFKYHSLFVWTTVLSLVGSVLFPGTGTAEESLHRIEAILHLDSTYSFGGRLTAEEIVKEAREKGIGAVIFSDDALIKVSYGLYPFRRLLKVSVQKNSVFKKGLHRYLKELEQLSQRYPDVLVIPGLEVTPFYYWEKSPLSFRGVIRDWHKHLLVMGLDEKDFKSLPLMGHVSLPLKPFEAKDLFRLWGILLIGIGIPCLKKRALDYRDERGRPLGPPSPLFQAMGWLLILVGVLSLIENYPYRRPGANIYSAEDKILPYQNLIDYVREKGGLVFWAHPEAKTVPHTLGPVSFLTSPYPEALLETENYTGFAIFHEGFKTIGPPGGIWDQLLLAYCHGVRQQPVWAVGELEYVEGGQAGTWIDTVKNIVFSKEKTQQALLKALCQGRMVITLRSREGEIDFGHFWVEDTEMGKRAQLGETLFLRGAPRIGISLSSKGRLSEARIRLIRGGEVVQEWQEFLPVKKVYKDLTFGDTYSYYRLEVLSVDSAHKLITNPIFVKR